MTQVVLHSLSLWNGVALVEAELVPEHVLTEPDAGKGVEQSLVQVVCHTAAILDLAQHVAQAAPVHPALHIHLVQVVLYKLHAGREVGLVELVRNVPAQRTKLASLLLKMV